MIRILGLKKNYEIITDTFDIDRYHFFFFYLKLLDWEIRFNALRIKIARRGKYIDSHG